MQKSKNYSAFTLIEMLIVMGILIILMGMGYAGGKFAIQRASDVAHKSAVKQLSEALQAYYTDHQKYPVGVGGTAAASNIEALITGDLANYMDSGSFSGGGDATYFYFAESGETPQSFLVCVTLRGFVGQTPNTLFCSGNGFNSLPSTAPIVSEETESSDANWDTITNTANSINQDWQDKDWKD